MKHCPNPDCPHLVRFGRISEFLDGVEQCSDCGTQLLAGDAPPPEPPSYHELVTIYTANDGVQAHLVRSALEANGIPVHIGGEALLGAVGELPAGTMQVIVQVPPQFAEQARQIALECDAEPSQPSPD